MNHLAVAQNDGVVTIRQVSGSENTEKNALIDLDDVVCTLSKSKDWIESMHYSPDGNMLAVGSHDHRIDVYICEQTGKYVIKCELNAHNSFITSMDWTLDSKWIRSVCGGYELLFHNIKDGKHDEKGAEKTKGMEWSSHKVKFGWRVEGIFPPGTDGTHVNNCCLSSDKEIIAVGCDFGNVRLYRNPCREGSKARVLRGHSDQVTNLDF